MGLASAFQPPLQQAPLQEPTEGKGSVTEPGSPKPPEVVEEGWHRERFALKKGKNKVELTGYLQEDLRYFDWEVIAPSASRRQAKEHELRRFRLGTKAQFGKANFEFQVEPRQLPTGSHLKNLSATYNFSRAFAFKAGFFKLPASREFNAPTNGTDFVDRSMIATRLVPDRDWGMTVGGAFSRFEYQAGVFRGDAYANVRRSGVSGVGRLSVELARGLQLSASFLQGRVTAIEPGGAVAPLPLGAYGQTATGFTFWGRPYVDGTRRRLSSSLTYSRGAFRILGEYLEESEERIGQGALGQDLPDVLGHGLSAQAAWLLIGERKGAVVQPRKSIFQGGPGAVELVARVETLKFDDTGDPHAPVSTSNRGANLAPAGASAVEAGVNYWASFFMKLQATAMWEKYDDPLTAPVPGRKGPYFSIIARVQFMFQ